MSSLKLMHVLEIVYRRQKRRAAEARSLPHRALHIGAFVLGAAGAALALIAVAALPLYLYITADLPDVQKFDELLNPQNGLLLQPTRFFDRTGEHELLSLQPTSGERRFIALNSNQFLADAFVASSDPQFWSRGDFSLPDLAAPPTLAEQLAAKVLLGREPEGWRKTLRAWMLGAAATQRYGREQVLTWELDSATFGHWTFGAESGAEFYFGKHASDLSLGEAALLAAVAHAPEINPLDAPQLAKQFRDLVLVAMRDQGTISDAELKAALVEAITTAAPGPTSEASDLAQLALEQAETQLGKETIERGGLRVITTLDYETQTTLAASLGSKQAQALVLDPINGRVVAMIGNVNESQAAESVLLPFDYLGSFASGSSPASLVWDIGTASALADSHGPTSMRLALANGFQFAAENVRNMVGKAHINSVLRAAGFAADDKVSAAEVAVAYGILSNSGLQAGVTINDRLQVSAILFVSDENGDIILDWSSPQINPIFSAQLSYLVTDVLQDVSVRDVGTRRIMNAVNRPAALAPSGSAHWMVGYTPQRVIAVWSEQPLDLGGLLAAAHRDLPIRSWQMPAGLTSVIVCVPSGLLPNEDCPQTRRELFLSGNEPRTVDSLYERVPINSLNGRLATVFTPQEFVDEKLFLNAPVFAEGWTQAAGLLAPKDYDTVSAINSLVEIHIDKPVAFNQLDGKVSILGTLGSEAVSYDVQVGQGLRPTQWLQIAWSNRPPSGDVLAIWDTSGLSGLWAIQLQVWDAEGHLHRAYTVVTIGN